MIDKSLNDLEEWLIGIFMAVATIVIFATVLHRYADLHHYHRYPVLVAAHLRKHTSRDDAVDH